MVHILKKKQKISKRKREVRSLRNFRFFFTVFSLKLSTLKHKKAPVSAGTETLTCQISNDLKVVDVSTEH